MGLLYSIPVIVPNERDDELRSMKIICVQWRGVLNVFRMCSAVTLTVTAQCVNNSETFKENPVTSFVRLSVPKQSSANCPDGRISDTKIRAIYLFRSVFLSVYSYATHFK
jgi:hypothetical protein